MLKSQKPSSFDLRVSDFKQIPGFNCVLSVYCDGGDEHTYNSLCSEIRDAWAIDAFFTFLPTYLLTTAYF